MSICSTWAPDRLRVNCDHRSIPLLHELPTPVQKLSESLWLEWVRSPQEYFEFRTPGSFKAIRQSSAAEMAPGIWRVSLDGERGAASDLRAGRTGGGLAGLHD